MSVGAVEPAPIEPDDQGGQATAEAGLHLATQASERPLTVVNGEIRLGERIGELWRHRQLLASLTRTQLKVKYKGSVLGYLWSMLNPALVLGIYYVAFTIINRGGIPHFAIWLFAGLLCWNLFNNASMGSTGVVVGNAGIIKKVSFPRELLALATVGVAMVLFVMQVVVLIIIMVAFGLTPAWQFVALLPLAIVGLLVFTSAMSIFLSAVNVYLRDTQHLTEVLLMAWFWFTPIVYTWGQINQQFASLRTFHFVKYVYLANPMAPIAMTFQRAIYGTDVNTKVPLMSNGKVNPSHFVLPTFGVDGYALMLFVVLAASTLLFLGALIVFGRLEGNFAEEL